jgi:hypothetical protein
MKKNRMRNIIAKKMKKKTMKLSQAMIKSTLTTSLAQSVRMNTSMSRWRH